MNASFHYILISTSDKVLSTAFQVVTSKANFCSFLSRAVSFPHELSLRKVDPPGLRHSLYIVQMPSAILGPFSGGYFCCSYRRGTPLTTGKQSFRVCMNVKHNFQLPKLAQFLIFTFLSPFPFWYMTSVLSSPLVSYKMGYHDQKRKKNSTCFSEIIRKQKLLVTVKVHEYYIIKN